MTKIAAGPAARVLIRAARPGDIERLRDILNTEILTSTASWTTAARTSQAMTDWMDGRVEAGFPVLVAVDQGTKVVGGYASYGPFRTGEGYAGTVEHSVYVHGDFRRSGMATSLIGALLSQATEAGKRLMIGGVSSDQLASLHLHRKLGFREVGRIPGAGHKFGKALDLVLMARSLLPGNAAPQLH